MIFGRDDIEVRLRARFEHGDPPESAAAAISWAAVKRNRGESAVALDLLGEAVRVGDRETGSRAWLALAESLAEVGEEASARHAYARVAELSDPALTPDVAIDLAARAEANGNEKGAAEIYREVLAMGPDPTLATLAALRLAAIHRAAHQLTLALGLLEDVYGLGEEGELAVEAELALAELLLEFSDQEPSSGERAEELLGSVIEFDHPDHSPRAALLLARRLGARQNFSRAFELLVAVIGCGSPEVVIEADAELSAQIARRSESDLALCVPLSWVERPVSAGIGEEGSKEATGAVPVLPEIGCADSGRGPRPALEVTCGFEPADARVASDSFTIHIPALAMADVTLPRGHSPLGGMIRRLCGFLLPTVPTHGSRSCTTAHVIDTSVFQSHRHAWRPAGGAAFAPFLEILAGGDHDEEALREMLSALNAARSPFGPLGQVLPRSPALMAWEEVFNVHRDRVAMALAEGLTARSAIEGTVAMSTFTPELPHHRANDRRGAVTCSARDDLSDFAVAFNEDSSTFLPGVLKPALKRDRVA